MACAAGRALRLVRRRLRSPVGAHARAAIRREHICGDRHGDVRSCWGSPAAAPSWPGARCAWCGRCGCSRCWKRAIALYALALPWGVHLTTPLIDAAAGLLSAPRWHALTTLAALLLLGLPAAAMGAGFPLLIEGWRRYQRNIGTAYGSNTLGAAAGALLPLLLLPSLGWTLAIRAVALLGLMVAAGLFALDWPGPRTWQCATREPGERTQALGAAAPQLRRYRRREPAVGNGLAAAVQPGDAAHRICAGADSRGDVVWHGARQPDRLEALRLPIDGGAALVRLGLRHRQLVAAARFLGLD